MALKKVRFIWGSPPLPDGRWRFGLFNLQQHPDPDRPLPAGGVPAYWKNYLHHTLHLSVRGLLRWAVPIVTIAYLSAAALLYVRHERANPHNRVGYLDLVLPTRWSERARLQGEGFILLAREKLASGHSNEGLGLLRLGLEKNPADFVARLDLSRLYLAMRLRPQAEKLLRDGLTRGYPDRTYLEAAFSLAAEGDNPPAWIELCKLARARLDSLPEASRPAGDSLWLDQQTVKALMADKRGAEAAALVAARYPANDPFRREIDILVALEAQDAPPAIAIASVWADEKPDDPLPLRLLVRAHRLAGDFSAMEEALLRFRNQSPTRPDALLYALVQNQLAGRTTQARAALDELLFRHGSSPDLYTTLATVLTEIRLADALPSLLQELRGRGLPPRPVLLAQLQADIAARAWPEALATAEEIRSDGGPAPSKVESVWLESMIRLARACSDGGSGTQSALVEIVADHPGTLRLYRLVLEALLDAGRTETASHILALAEGPYPSARCLATTRAVIDSRRADLAAAEPSPAASSPPAQTFASLKALTDAVSNRVREKDAAGALALLAAARRAQPAWLAGSEHRLDALELPLHARGDDSLRLQLLVRNTLARDADGPALLLDLARAADGEGHRANAVLIVKEILRRDPAHPDAIALLAVWEPRPRQPAADEPAP